jgi:hypothetical protein
MRIDARGNVGIGATALTRTSLSVSKNITGSTLSIGIGSDGVIQSDVTSQAYYFLSASSTDAASFTLATLYHYRATQGTFGAGSTVTTQIGFAVDNLIGATTNYGFFGNIASGTNRWNLYMNGTANNYLAGKLLIGSTTDSGATLQVTGSGRFTGDVELNGASGTRTLTIQNNTSGNAVLALVAAGSNSGTITYSRSTSELVFGNSGATSAFKIAATGDATFSSTVLVGNGAAQTELRINSLGGTNQGPFMRFQKAGSNKGYIGTYSAIISGTSDDLTYYATGAQQWMTNNSTTTKMTLDASGRLGIGTTPSYKLHIIESTTNGRAVQGVATATSGTNYGAVLVAEGIGATKNIGLYASAEGATTNVAAVFDSGNVGIGTSSPSERLEVSTSSGNIYIRTTASDGSNAGIRMNSVGQREYGIFSDGALRFYDFTASTDRMRITSGGVITIANLAGTGNRIVGADSSGNLSSITVGSGLSLSAGVLTATGGSAGTVTGSGSSSQVPFWTSSSNISGDNGFIWDNTNKRLGVGTTSPSAVITGFSNTAATQFKAAGVAPAMTFSDTLTSATYAAVFGLATSNNQFVTGTATGDFAIANQSTTAGAIVFGTGTTEKFRMSSAGNLLLGTSSDNGYKLQINGSASFAYGFTNVFRGSSGANDILVGNTGSTFYVGGSVTATGGFFDTSDSRLKILVKDYEQPKGIENVAARMYVKNSRKELGYYAQDLQEILPSAVSEGDDGFLTLSYSQVHTAKIAYLEEKVAKLEELIKQLL